MKLCIMTLDGAHGDSAHGDSAHGDSAHGVGKWHDLEAHGFECVLVYSMAQCKECDLVLLYLSRLTDRAIQSVLALRSLLQETLLCIQLDAPDAVRALLLRRGLDEVVDMHCGPAEFAARLSRLTGRQTQSSSVLEAGCLRMDRLERRAWIIGKPVRLMPREFELLAYLVEQAPRVVGKDELRTRLWGFYFDPGTNSVEVHVCRLRRKLADAGDWIKIVTVRGAGYCLNPETSIGHGQEITRPVSSSDSAGQWL